MVRYYNDIFQYMVYGACDVDAAGVCDLYLCAFCGGGKKKKH